MTSSLERLATAAPDFVVAREAEPTVLHADVTVGTSESQTFGLEIRLVEGVLRVRERQPTLPLWCPERHIVKDGYFCLGLDWSCPSTDEAARRWWLSLARYLELQVDARFTRSWPKRHARRHGSAALAEVRVELALEDMPQSFQDRVRAGKVRLLDERGRPVMRVRDGEVYGEVPPMSRRGPGGRPLYRKERERYSRSLVSLAVAVEEMVAEEEAFWAAARAIGCVCCGTMEACPLGRSGENPQR